MWGGSGVNVGRKWGRCGASGAYKLYKYVYLLISIYTHIYGWMYHTQIPMYRI